MAGGYLYGDMTWTSQNRRNQAVTFMRNEATARGFTDAAFGQYAAGVVTVGTVGLTFCWSSPDYDALEASQTQLLNYINSNGGVDGQVATTAA